MDSGFYRNDNITLSNVMNTELKALLLERKSTILGKWFDEIVETYPPETSRFLKNQKNRFTNPVGHTILQGIDRLFEELLSETDFDPRVFESSFLDNIIRIRAVQDFTPSRAIAFILLLKKVIREELKDSLRENGIVEGLLKFESKIDDVALLSFDIYMKCREKIYEIKVNEFKNMTFRLLQKANLVCEIEE